MNILGKFTALAALALATTALGSCDSMFHDDLADCPQGVYVRFYQQKDNGCFDNKAFLNGAPSKSKPSFTPVGKVSNLYVLAFDKKTGLLANYVAADKEINLSRTHETLIPLTQGDYELVAWSGNADNFRSANLQKGVTKKSDVFFQLRQQQDGSLVFPNTPEPLRYGFAGTGNQRQPSDSLEYVAAQHAEVIADDVINIPDPVKFGSVFRHAAINLREQALNVKVQVVVDASVKRSKYPTTADKFSVNLKTAGTALSHTAVKNGLLADWQTPQAALSDTAKLALMQPIDRTVSNDTLTLNYHLLGNTWQSLADGRLELSHDGTAVENGSDIPRKLQTSNASLSLRGLIREAIASQNLSLTCSSDVTIVIRVKNRCEDCKTYMSYDVKINQWAVHSYGTDL